MLHHFTRRVGRPVPTPRPFRPGLVQLDDRIVPALVFREAAATDVAGITPIRDQFRADLGGGTTAGANGSFGGLRREINWDGTPAAKSAPNALPPDFFNVNSPRGAVFSTTGTGFQVSGNTADAGTGQPALEFTNLNATYPTLFDAFSPQRLFTPVGSNVMDVTFFVPGTSTPATVNGFGVVFSDVDLGGTTGLQFFDANGVSLVAEDAPATPGNVNGGFSFVGGFNDDGLSNIAKVRIFTGNTAVGAAETAGTDIVVMDDFLYGEPREATANAYALSGNNLISLGTSNPGGATTPLALAGVTAGETLVGFSVRPQNGYLYALGVNAAADTATLYNVSARTGVAFAVGTASQIAYTTDGVTKVDLPDPVTTSFGVDFNPLVDRVRVVAGSLNFRIDPNSGAPADGNNGGAVTPGTNPDGAINGPTTTVGGTAYTNSQPNATNTTQYTIDAATDKIYIQNAPNSGMQTMPLPITLGGNPLDFTRVGGFDIPAGVNAAAPSGTPVTSGSGFAVLTVGGTTQLYRIDLVTGAATAVGAVGGAAAANGLTVLSNAAGAVPVVSLQPGGPNLVRFNTTTPGTTTTVAITGLVAGETLVGIDTRPATGQLYGLGVDAANDKSTLYLLDPQTGVATAVGTASQVAFTTDGVTKVDFPIAGADGYGFDFNPTVDRIRVTTSSGLNFRLNPNDGASVDGDNGTGAAVTGTNPDKSINGAGFGGVDGAAYTNSFGGAAATTLYTIDSFGGQLFIQNPANAGTLTNPVNITVGGTPLITSSFNSGFDIAPGVTVAGSGTAAAGRAFAVLDVGGAMNLYSIDLTTGAATALGVASATLLSGLSLGDAAAGVISFSVVPASATEGKSAALTLTRSGGSSGTVSVTVNFTTGTAGTADYTTTPVVVTFADGQTTATASVPLTQDNIFEGNETFTATIGAVSGGAAVGAVGTATVTITDDETQPFITTADAKVTEGNTGTTTLTFTLTLTGPASKDVTVQFKTVDITAVAGKDYTAVVAQTVTIPAGQLTATFNVDVTGETTFETDQTFNVTLSNATVAQLGPTNFAIGTIVNDDTQPVVTINNVSAGEGNTGTTAVTFTVSLSNPSDQPVTVTVNTADGTAKAGKDYTAVTGQVVTFAPGTTTQTVTVNAAGDVVFEGDETFTVTLSNPNGGTLGTTATGTGTITNDDAAPVLSVSTTKLSVTEGNSGKTPVTVTFTLTGATELPVTVDVTEQDITTSLNDFDSSATTLTFAPGETTKTYTVNVIGDTLFEADETFTVGFVGGASGVTGATTDKSFATVTITNDDTAPTVSVAGASVAEGNSGTKAVTFTLTLSAASGLPVTVDVASADGTATAGTDYVALAKQTVTFAPGETTKTVTVTVNGDTAVEPDETFTLALSNPTGATLAATGPATGTITNDDAAPPTVSVANVIAAEGNSGTTTMTFTLTLSAASGLPVTVDVASADGTATAGTDYVALAKQTVTFAPGETTKTVTVTVNGDTAVEPDETFTLALSNPTGATLAATGPATGTITNDDAAPVARPLLVGFPQFAAGADRGSGSVQFIDQDKSVRFTVEPFGNFTGGVRTAAADFNADGVADLVVGTGPGRATQVRVLDGKTQAQLFTIDPFEASFTGGVYVAAGDLTGDGIPDLVITPDEGGGPRCRVFSGVGFGQVTDFFGIDDPNFRGGARPAIGDVNGDGAGDLVVAAGFLGGPRVATFSGTSLSSGPVKLFNDFFAFEQTLRNGVFITVGDLDGDGKAELIAGGGPGGGPRVTAFAAKDLISSGGGTLTQVANFFGGDPNNRGGIRVAVKNLDNDARADIVVSAGSGAGSRVTGYLGANIQSQGTPPAVFDFDAFSGFTGGVFVG